MLFPGLFMPRPVLEQSNRRGIISSSVVPYVFLEFPNQLLSSITALAWPGLCRCIHALTHTSLQSLFWHSHDHDNVPLHHGLCMSLSSKPAVLTLSEVMKAASWQATSLAGEAVDGMVCIASKITIS